ncbi:hypothetical protein F5880DRAFT_1605095 [Lentinula raphanica]|nr:hypothetical protein F5880DRAFT_1605095 [Lentinula raphanica]
MPVAGLLLLALTPFITSQDDSALQNSSAILLNQQITLLSALYFHFSTLSRSEARKPCPEIGGQRITREYLLGLSPEECVWRFRGTGRYGFHPGRTRVTRA